MSKSVQAPITDADISKWDQDASHRTVLPQDDRIRSLIARIRDSEVIEEGHVKMPTNADEAAAMEMIGYSWLHHNAPKRLKSASESVWQDIATAPRDGTEILVYREDAGVFTAHYVEEDAHISSPMNPPEGDFYWFSTCGDDLTGDMPTHWQPLPTPPTLSSESIKISPTATGIKPCPFCGSSNIWTLPPSCEKDSPYDPADRAMPVARCRDCYAEAMGKNWDVTCESAIEAWNRRTSPPKPLSYEGEQS